VGRAALSAAVVAAVGAAAGAMVVAADGDGERVLRASRAALVPSLPPGGIRGCRERVEGGRFAVDPARETMIGPVTFVAAASNYRTAARSRDQVTPEYLPGLNAHPMKVLALVSAGTRATLTVPRQQRAWMRLFYSGRNDAGQHSITLEACRRLASRDRRRRECGWSPRTACSWVNTQFAGGVYIDFDRAPKLGRCAELIVRAGAHPQVFRGPLFRPLPGACQTPTVARPASFESLPAGWRQFADSGTTLGRRGDISETFVTSWHYRSHPHGPAGDLPPGGVLITVLLIRRAAGGRPAPALCRGVPRSPEYPQIQRLPLRLPTTPATTLEGYERVPEYRIFGAIRHDYHVEVRVDINQQNPGRSLLRRAQRVLNRLRLPDWPNRC
jgi:hypothetical protein